MVKYNENGYRKCSRDLATSITDYITEVSKLKHIDEDDIADIELFELKDEIKGNVTNSIQLLLTLLREI